MSLPATLRINALIEDVPVASDVAPTVRKWALRQQPNAAPSYLWGEKVDQRNWRNPQVGWGLVLPERPGLSPEALASGSDAPEPIRALLKDRGGPVFRYSLDKDRRLMFLRNYASGRDIAISGAPQGIKSDALPYYLLIYASPTDVPWELQYILNTFCAVGRLDLEGDALQNYVQALLNDWKDTTSEIRRSVVWAVDHGGNDITSLMRDAIAAKVHAELASDHDLQPSFIDGTQAPAKGADLIDALSTQHPALVVTTSHGKTGPLNDPAAMKATLGVPVDAWRQPLDIDQLLAAWQPDGAIWYAHACCSAGSAGLTLYNGLVKADSEIDKLIKGVAGLGSLIAPFPKALLGAKKPLRAFIGQVEPTFDWTIQQPKTGQYLTANIVQALHNRLYFPEPIGLALEACYRPVGTLYTQYYQAERIYNQGTDSIPAMLYCRLAAADIQSMVILGDPTAVLPVPSGNG